MKRLNDSKELHFGDLTGVFESLGKKVLFRGAEVERVNVFSENDDKVGQSHGVVFGSLHEDSLEKISRPWDWWQELN